MNPAPDNLVRQASGPAPALSILVPVYNTAPYLRDTLISVLSQPGLDFEVVAVDDGSTDDSAAILDAIKDPRLTVVRLSANQGRGAARNEAARHARADWLCPFDSDDIMLPNTLAGYFRDVTGRPDCGWGYCGLRALDETLTEPRGEMNQPFDWVRFLRVMLVTHGMSLFRKDLFAAAGGYPIDLPRGQDYYLFLRLLEWGVPAHYNQICFLYRQRADVTPENQAENRARVQAAWNDRRGRNRLGPRGPHACWVDLGADLVAAFQGQDWPRVVELGRQLQARGVPGFELDQYLVIASIKLGQRRAALAQALAGLQRLGRAPDVVPGNLVWMARETLRMALQERDPAVVAAVQPVAAQVQDTWPDQELGTLLAAAGGADHAR